VPIEHRKDRADCFNGINGAGVGQPLADFFDKLLT